MLHSPFLPPQDRDDLVLGRLWPIPVSPLVRVPTSARAAHLYVIGQSGKGKENPSCWSTASIRILPPDMVAPAQERGRARDLDATVAELLAELDASGIASEADPLPE